MPRAIRVLALLGAPFALLSCFADPACQDTCDGDRIHRCAWECNGGGGKLDPPEECHRVESQEACPTATTCVMGVAVNSDQGHPVCIRAPLVPCDPPWHVVCLDAQTAASCRGTEGGGFVDQIFENRCASTPGTECHDSETGARCVDAPKASCDPGHYPACRDAKHVVQCVGTPTDGYAETTVDCQDRSCAGAPGGAGCR